METLAEKVARVVQEHVSIVPYDPKWPVIFQEEKRHLLSCIPGALIRRIEHFGSTAVPGLSAKPVVDMLVEVTSLIQAKEIVPPILEPQGYEYFWRPTWQDNIPPFYAWFIKRNSKGVRTHHIHMVESHFEHWDRLLFRDYLIDYPQVAKEYELIKQGLADTYNRDRVEYTKAKTDFIEKITKIAIGYYVQDKKLHFK